MLLLSPNFFPYSSICCSVAAPSCAYICRNFCFTKLLALILISSFTGILLSYRKKIVARVYLTCFSHCYTQSDIETNLGPKHCFSSQDLKIYHLNLNSLLSHMYKKVSLLSVYISVPKFDIICLSEAYLNSETSSDNSTLGLRGYNIIINDQPSNIKRGTVCVYYKSTLSFKLIGIKYLREYISFEIRIRKNVANLFAFVDP